MLALEEENMLMKRGSDAGVDRVQEIGQNAQGEVNVVVLCGAKLDNSVHAQGGFGR